MDNGYSSDEDGAVLREDERRLILSQYRDALAQMNLPPATAARLQNLLEDRVEAVLDAEDADMRAGFAMGSAETSRTVAWAIADVDREIANLLSTAGFRPASPPSIQTPPAAPPDPAVTVVVAPAVAIEYAAPEAQPAAPNDTSAYPYLSYPYLYFPAYPLAMYVTGGFSGGRSRHWGTAEPRSFRPPAMGGIRAARQGR
jgi:hypothetical protein